MKEENKLLTHLKRLMMVLHTAVKAWWEKDPFRESAVIAYYAIFSLPALLVLIITVAGFFWSKEAINEHILNQVSGTMGSDTSEQIAVMLGKASEAKNSLWATILGIIILLSGATGVFVQLQKALNVVWHVKAVPGKGLRNMVKTRLLSFGLILSLAFLLLISLVISTALAAMGSVIETETSSLMLVIVYILNFVISLLVITVLFGLIFKILPDVKIPWRHVMAGALITALLFMAGKMGLALYFANVNPGSGYGAAGSIILILLWVSYTSMILFLGAEVTYAFSMKVNHRVTPSENAVKVPAVKRAKKVVKKPRKRALK